MNQCATVNQKAGIRLRPARDPEGFTPRVRGGLAPRPSAGQSTWRSPHAHVEVWMKTVNGRFGRLTRRVMSGLSSLSPLVSQSLWYSDRYA